MSFQVLGQGEMRSGNGLRRVREPSHEHLHIQTKVIYNVTPSHSHRFPGFIYFIYSNYFSSQAMLIQEQMSRMALNVHVNAVM